MSRHGSASSQDASPSPIRGTPTGRRRVMASVTVERPPDENQCTQSSYNADSLGKSSLPDIAKTAEPKSILKKTRRHNSVSSTGDMSAKNGTRTQDLYAEDAAVQKKLAEIEEHDNGARSHDEADSFQRGGRYYNSDRHLKAARQPSFKTHNTGCKQEARPAHGRHAGLSRTASANALNLDHSASLLPGSVRKSKKCYASSESGRRICSKKMKRTRSTDFALSPGGKKKHGKHRAHFPDGYDEEDWCSTCTSSSDDSDYERWDEFEDSGSRPSLSPATFSVLQQRRMRLHSDDGPKRHSSHRRRRSRQPKPCVIQ